MRVEVTYKILHDDGDKVIERKVGCSYDDDLPQFKEAVAKKLGELLQFNLEKDFGLDPKPKNPYFQK